MINPKIFKAILIAATKETKDAVLEELIVHISRNYDYNDTKAGHIVEMLIDKKEVVTPSRINLDYIEKNPKLIMYNHEKYNIKNITIDTIDNIDCVVIIRYDYIEKINEDRADISYLSSTTSISFVDNPQILK